MSAHRAMRRLSLAALAIAIAIMTVAGCQSSNPSTPIRTASFVDLEQFSGLWYVIATIPTPFERDVYNATEYYAPPEGNRIATFMSCSNKAPDLAILEHAEPGKLPHVSFMLQRWEEVPIAVSFGRTQAMPLALSWSFSMARGGNHGLT